MVQESTQERLFLWCGKQVFLQGMSHTLCLYPCNQWEAFSIGGLVFFFWGWFPLVPPLFPMLFSSCSHGCSQKVPQVILSCLPPKAFIPNLCSPPTPKCQWKERWCHLHDIIFEVTKIHGSMFVLKRLVTINSFLNLCFTSSIGKFLVSFLENLRISLRIWFHGNIFYLFSILWT
jgi:hypothetical protein